MRPSERGASLPRSASPLPVRCPDARSRTTSRRSDVRRHAAARRPPDLARPRRRAPLGGSDAFAVRRPTGRDRRHERLPVPDGDTGTNLYLTFDGAVERTLATADVTTADELLSVFAKHLLWTARGNSGVILSQLARGLAEGCAGAARIDGRILAAGLRHAEVRARQAVTDPKEGTILTVASAMAEAAERAAHQIAQHAGGSPIRMPPTT